MCPTHRCLVSLVTLCVCSSVLSIDVSPPLINIIEKTAIKPEGSCVTINCSYSEKSEQLLWFKNPVYNELEKRFNGTIVYSNTKEQPQSPEYLNRVHFLTDDKAIKDKYISCSLRISDLQKHDSGEYKFRFINELNKYMSEPMALSITDNPCRVHVNLSELNKTIKEDDTLILYCVTPATCDDFPEWEKFSTDKLQIKNEQINGKEEKNTKLTLKVDWKHDGTTLKCYPANNKDDCLVRSVTLNVEHVPKDTKVSKNYVEAKEGEDVKISCSSKANPNPTFKWVKSNNTTFSQEGTMLYLPSIKPEDRGDYYCKASNKHGKEISHKIVIDVLYPPKEVSVIANSNNLTRGDELTLECKVKSSNPEVLQGSYKWFQDKDRIYGNRNKLIISNIQPSQRGSYSCQAKNVIQATLSNDINISVMYAPQQTRIGGTFKVKLGHTLPLRCTTDANPLPYNYSWYFKQEHTDNYVCLLQTQFSIGLVNVSQAGWYMCSARNNIGQGENSTEVNVSILYPPREFNLSVKPVVREYEMLIIQCTVKSSPPSNITLSRTSPTEPQSRSIMVSASSNILIFYVNVSESHSGIYKCMAENTEGKNYTTKGLKVLYSPKNVEIKAHPGTELKEGLNLTLTCTARSDPPVSSYIWMKSVESQSVTVESRSMLAIHFLKDSDSGNYSCMARNDLGRTPSGAVHIRVKYRPRITVVHNLTSLSNWASDVPVHLSCTVHCYPPATSYAWFRLENKTPLSTSQSYTVQPQNPGTYYCSATNEMGSTNSEPVQLYANGFSLLYFFISVFVLCILICIMFLVCRILAEKRFFGPKEEREQSFFLSLTPTLSSTLSNLHLLGSRINTQENLLTEGIPEQRALNNQRTGATNQNPSASRNNQGSVSNIYAMPDAAKFSHVKSKGQHYTEEDLTTVNYVTLQFPTTNNSKKSASKSDNSEIIYAKVSKNKKCTKDANADYENVTGAFASKPPFSNTNWDWDSSDDDDDDVDEEVNYSTVTVHHNPRKPKLSLDDDDKTEYSAIKV